MGQLWVYVLFPVDYVKHYDSYNSVSSSPSLLATSSYFGAFNVVGLL